MKGRIIMKKAEKGLTSIEQSIMKVLWNNEKAMTNAQIAECLKSERISVASVAQAMKRLITKGAVKVEDYILVSNVYARTFLPCITREQFIKEELDRVSEAAFFNPKKGGIGLFAYLLQSDNGEVFDGEDLKELDNFLEEKKKKMRDEK